MSNLPISLQAFIWGGVSGSALMVGAFIGYFIKLPHRFVSGVMAFGVGVLISTLSFNLMAEAVEEGTVLSSGIGFLLGVAIYSGANALLAHQGAKHRKRSIRSGINGGTAVVCSGSAGTAIAIGSLVDGVPESAAIGFSLLDGQGVSLMTVIAIFISNVPEGLSSSVGFRKDGKSPGFVFGLWISIGVASALAAFIGYSVIGGMSPTILSAATAVAAGAILVMVIQTMIPEAFEDIHNFTGPIAAVGFLLAFIGSQLMG